MEKQLTFLITVYENYDLLDRIMESLSNLEDRAEVLFAFDHSKEDIPVKTIESISDNGYKVFVNGENTGKLKLIANASHKLETRFFKIIDPDDSVYLERIDELNKALSKLDEESLVKHRGTKLYLSKKTKDIFYPSNEVDVLNKQLKLSKDIHLAQQTNCDTIYPTKVVREMNNVPLTRQTFHNDVLLSNFVYGLTNKLVKVKEPIYIQFHGAGQTNKVTIERAECVVELYNNYLKIKEVYPEFKFRKLMWGMKISHVFFIKAFTKWYLKNTDKQKGKETYKESIRLLNKNNKLK